MLVNESKLQGVNVKDLFTRMVSEVPWVNLKAYVQTNAQLLKMATIGGHPPTRRTAAVAAPVVKLPSIVRSAKSRIRKVR